MSADFQYPSGAARKIHKVVKQHLRTSELVKAMEPGSAHWIVMGWAGDDNWYYLGWIARVQTGSHVTFDVFAMPEDYEVSYYNHTPPVGIPVTNADRCATAVEMLVKHWEER
jgi:hypothetical protein